MSGVMIATVSSVERDCAFHSLGAYSQAAQSARQIASVPGASPEWAEVADRIDAVCEALRKIVRPS